MSEVEVLSKKFFSSMYYCGLEPAIDQETRFFSNTTIGPLIW